MSMHPTTSQALVLSPPAQPVHLHRADTLQALVDLAGFNPSIGMGVQDLTISIAPGPGQAMLASAIRRALRLTPNLVSLVLNLPPTMPAFLLGSLVLPRLKRFSTTLPHQLVAPFLSAHPFIETLILRAVRCNACPLRGLGFPLLTNLQCASRCFVTGVAYERPPTIRLPLAPISSLLNRHASPSRLQALTIDYFPNETDILARVAAAVPNIQKLKLNEKAHPQQQNHGVMARRAWDDLPEWHRTLLRMPFLEEFMLRTSVSVSNRNRSELSVVFGWVNGNVRRPSYHPSIFRIGLIQRDSTDGQQRLSHWFKSGRGEWQCVTRQAVGNHYSFSL